MAKYYGGIAEGQRMNLTHVMIRLINKNKVMKNTKNTKQNTANPFENRDLNQQLRFPTISWSSLNSFTDYDKDEWYNSYVLGIRQPPNKAMQIGIEVGERITQDPTYLPTIERPETFEKELEATLNGIHIRGHIDGYTHNVGIDEYKTSLNKDRWTQKKVDSWGQVSMYCLLVWLNFKIPPEKLHLRLYAIPITEHNDFSYTAGEPVCFNTKRTMKDILLFAKFIKDTHKDMTLFVKQKENEQ